MDFCLKNTGKGGQALVNENITFLAGASWYCSTDSKHNSTNRHISNRASHLTLINTFFARGAATLLNRQCTFPTWFSTAEWLFYCFVLLTQKVGIFDWFVSFSYRTFLCRGLKIETLRHHVERQQPNTVFIQSFTVFSIGKICSHS